jgi:hypothetical protein
VRGLTRFQSIAIKMYSIVPNSMSEERTMSNLTLVNSALRSRQGVQTMVDQVQIRQYYRTKNPVSTCSTSRQPLLIRAAEFCWQSTPKLQPFVRFADLASIYNSNAVSKDGVKKQAEAPQEEDKEMADDGWLSQRSDNHPVGRNKALDIEVQIQLNDAYFQDLLADKPRMTTSWTLPVTISEAPSDLAEDDDMDLECSWD